MIDTVAYFLALLKLGWPLILVAIIAALAILYPLTDVYHWLERKTREKQLNKFYGKRRIK